jgi:multidrug efflux pump subunit AcrB
MAQLHAMAREIQARLTSIPEVESAVISGRQGQQELRFEPIRSALTAYRLFPEEVLNMLNIFRREGMQMSVGFTLADGRELPMTVRRIETDEQRAVESIENLRLATEQGAMPLGAVTTGRTVPPAPAIAHHNGRRELAISYSLRPDAPETGPERIRLDEGIRNAVRDAYRPAGYTIEAIGAEASTDWFRVLFNPILLLLFAVLAIEFE